MKLHILNAKKAQAVEIFLIVMLIIVFAFLLVFIFGKSFQDNSDNHIKSNAETKELELGNYSFVMGQTDDCQLGDSDIDEDGIADLCDNCPSHYNPEQEDRDLDGKGDACDSVKGDSDHHTTHDECDDNLDCDDDNRYTKDICENPDEDDSECVYEDILCLSDLDCGIDGFIGSPFCTEDNVTRTYKEYTCHVSGTVESYCSSSTESQVIEECELECSNGICVNESVVCEFDSDCDDGNSLTYDECLNPGTSDSECSNIPIECASDLDCGIDGFEGVEFCIGNDIYNNYTDYMCVDPAMLNSRCTDEIIPQLIFSCENACYDGTCIACDENSDCNDNNPGTEDSCVLPGTLLSYCVNEEFSCQDECENGARQCIGENGARICGDFDGNGCSEWSGVAKCGYGRICRLGYCG